MSAKSLPRSRESKGNTLCFASGSGSGISIARISSTTSLNLAGCAVHKKRPVSPTATAHLTLDMQSLHEAHTDSLIAVIDARFPHFADQ